MLLMHQQETQQGKAILLVEDDESITQTLVLILQQEGCHHVLPFANGYEALAHLDQIKRFHPSLFLLDYRLPGMSGVQFYEQIRQIEELKHVPAVMLSAGSNAMAEAEEHNIPLLMKPFDLDDLLEVVEETAL